MIKRIEYPKVSHPWHSDIEAGMYSGLHLEADSQEELLEAVKQAEDEGWNAWIVGTRENDEGVKIPSAYLYRLNI